MNNGKRKYNRENFLNVFMNADTPELDLSSGDFWLLFKTTDKPRLYQVDAYEEFRPDIISFKTYEHSMYWWILMKYNDVIDPFSELVRGTVLRVPSLKDIQSFQRASKKLKSKLKQNVKDI